MFQEGMLQRYEMFAAAAAVSAHAHAPEEGFRQRDIKFLIELFTNWIESMLGAQTLPIQGTQVLRYLEMLVAEGYARKTTRKKAPNYRLTRTGLIELLSRMTYRGASARQEDFYFIFYFISSYAERIEALVRVEGQQFPPSLQLEVRTLLSTENLLHAEIARVRKALTGLEDRMRNGKSTVSVVRQKQTAAVPASDIILEVQKRFPYELNSQKPLSELLTGIPSQYRLWELTEGTERRVTHLWEPIQRNLSSYLAQLQTLVT